MCSKIEDLGEVGGSPSGVFPRWALMRLLYQQWRSPAVYAAVRLGIADSLGDGSRTVAQLARRPVLIRPRCTGYYARWPELVFLLSSTASVLATVRCRSCCAPMSPD